ncbi:ThiF family adenylyltransferase [Limnohabitans sp.]|uniref:tRNA threonylcarbamoyladenosine dehydratase n=1 Tax=Limnohabitans sp. TaxID=1907725 RepID=UPI0035B41994
MAEAPADSMVPADADDARRFGGLDRLYGIEAAQYLRRAHVVVVGLGGVGSWAAEALARSGISRLTLIDMDHIAESNINRQIHALSSTLGQSKIEAMRERIAQIHPECQVELIDDFVSPENWPALLQERPDALIDACDQIKAKQAMALWALKEKVPFVCVGAAGGKRLAHQVDVDDLAQVTHDPLLAQLRYRLRKHHGAPRQGKRMGVRCVFSREAVAGPDASCALEGDGSLNCHGYGSLVGVTATFGMCAATEVMNMLVKARKA